MSYRQQPRSICGSNRCQSVITSAPRYLTEQHAACLHAACLLRTPRSYATHDRQHSTSVYIVSVATDGICDTSFELRMRPLRASSFEGLTQSDWKWLPSLSLLGIDTNWFVRDQ